MRERRRSQDAALGARGAHDARAQHSERDPPPS